MTLLRSPTGSASFPRQFIQFACVALGAGTSSKESDAKSLFVLYSNNACVALSVGTSSKER